MAKQFEVSYSMFSNILGCALRRWSQNSINESFYLKIKIISKFLEVLSIKKAENFLIWRTYFDLQVL